MLKHTHFAVAVVVFGLVALLTAPGALAQAGLSTGIIQGNILDPNGASVPNAKVTITSKGTGAKQTPEVTSAGSYSSGPLVPGEYLLRVEASGFRAVEQTVTVQVGNITPANIALEVGSETTVVTVEGAAVSVNTDQAAIQGVVTSTQIENLPINGRNFLDLAQLEPGVQIQDGGNFDPTKKGFSSISFGGRFGRTARIEVDGLDISDETVGTTTQNISVGSIKEFQVSQSSLDLATELTSSGTVNITTRSGTNQVHGDGFFNYRGDATSAKFGDPPAKFDRKQYGVSLGGPIIKDRLFAFGSGERTTQDLLATVNPAQPFDVLSGSFNSPFRDQQWLGRLDYNASPNVRFFFKYTYEQNRAVGAFVPGTYSPFANVDNTPSYGGGVDFTTGSFTHSFRIGYMKFRNGITDAVAGTNIVNVAPGVMVNIGNDGTGCTSSGEVFCSGANILAPQKTYQSNKQFKYDGSKVFRSHIFRYGVGYNRILGGGFASFYGIDPAVRAAFTPDSQAAAASGPFPGGASNPLNYTVSRIRLGNGQGCFTEIHEFGQDCGGQFDSRFQVYLGDSWKVKPNFTLVYGVRYNRDTGRTDADLGPIPCSDAPSVGCTGNLLDQVRPGFGRSVNQPDNNVGGTLGFAWDPWKNGKTSIRAGAGIYYENAVFNNVLFDRPGRLPTGLFNLTQDICPSGALDLPDGTVVDTLPLCSQPIGNVVPQVIALQQQFQQATAQAGAQANGGYVANALAAGAAVTGVTLYSPNYQSPRSYQMNAGVQRQLKPGTVVSVDYLRNVGVHTLLAVDENHVGDPRFLDSAGASAAIGATLGMCGATSIDAAIANCHVDNGDGTFTDRPATIADFANNGLTDGNFWAGGFPVGAGQIAFPGKNPVFGQMQFLEPVGRSVYNGLQVKLTSDLKSPFRAMRYLNAQISYSLARFNSEAQDVDFINNAVDYNNPGRFFGPNGLDRTHQLSAGVVMELPAGVRINMITHWYTALPQTITFAAPGDAEDIFQFDTAGDGQTTLAPVPGSNIGSFGRDIKASGLNSFLNQYSNNAGNQLTPAGQALVSAGLFTQTQLQQLCAVTPSLNPTGNCAAAEPQLQLTPAPPGNVGNDAFFTFDLRLGWAIRPVRKWEHFRIEPQAAFYNLFNRHNYNAPDAVLAGTLDGGSTSINGATKATRLPLLTGLGSGVFALGAPRSMEFGIKATF
ncbi:MAG TPA: TonB-dependent receptor [Terriglobales bacterium]|nr:TonB-dependent receptor [Terriglobales bacterium]